MIRAPPLPHQQHSRQQHDRNRELETRARTRALQARQTEDVVLIVSSIHSEWIAAVNTVLEEIGVPIQTLVVSEGGYREKLDHWNQVEQIGLDGALLIRPDQHIV